MAEDKIFVGRKAELEQFKKVLEEPQGQAVLVVGHRGMGKTWLINKMAELAQNHPNFDCGCVRYEVTPTDSVDSTMALMMDNAFEAAQIKDGSFSGTTLRMEQWRSLLNVINLGDLVMSLRRDPAKNTRDQFLERLQLISKRMPENGRAIFIIDPEKYLQEKSGSDWHIVVKELPDKIIFLFGQRTEDELVKSKAFMTLENVKIIPQDYLGSLAETEVHKLVRLRANSVGQEGRVLCNAVERYKGHPYATQAALDIVKKTKSVEALPQDPTPEAIAEAQWDEVCKLGADAISLFESYAIIEVGVPDEIVQKVSSLNANKRKQLQKDMYLRGLLREEGYGKRIYHVILADHITEQIGEIEIKKYHNRAVKVYRKRLKADIKPDAIAAMRLAEHVLSVEGVEAFVDVFISEVVDCLLSLGLFDTAESFSKRVLSAYGSGGPYEAIVGIILGRIYRTRGNLEKAKKMFQKAVDIFEHHDLKEGIAQAYLGLGTVHMAHGELDEAEKLLQRALKIDRGRRNLEGIANGISNLGLVYMKRGSLDSAEKAFRKAIRIDKQLGRLESLEVHYGNLAILFNHKGMLDEAEEMHLKGLGIAEQLGCMASVSKQCTNLGAISQTRNDLEKAEKMYLKALEIDRVLGNQIGEAICCGNLGLIYMDRDNMSKAERMFHDALEINKKVGDMGGVSREYGHIGLLYQEQGKLSKAEQMHLKALQISKRLGVPEAVALHYGNLGVLYYRLGELDKAERMHRIALKINEKISRPEGIGSNYTNLGLIYVNKRNFEKSQEYLKKARDLYAELGIERELERIQLLINWLKDKKKGVRGSSVKMKKSKKLKGKRQK